MIMPHRTVLPFCFAITPKITLLTSIAPLLLLCMLAQGDEPTPMIAPRLFTQAPTNTNTKNNTEKQLDRLALPERLTCETNLPAPDSIVTFYAMGDVPYAPEENFLLPKQIANMPTDGRFLMHVGDIKNGATPCDEAVYIKVASMLAKSKLPTFIIPGDNEWNDCENPAQGWKYWLKHFNNFDTKWKYDFVVHRQKVRNENFAFQLDGVLFIGINLVGGRVHDAVEWKTRHAQNITWIESIFKANHKKFHAVVLFGHALPMVKHNDFFIPLLPIVKTTNVPLLYLHGDGHKWIKDKPLGTDLITRVQVDQGGIAPPVKVTVTHDPNKPFIFDRRLPKTP
jgi:hypothetical protein